MATKKKMLQAAAGQAGGAALDITDVFSTYLYDGTGSAQTITNGIDLAGEGGLVWVKSRNYTYGHALSDTEHTVGNYVSSNNTDAIQNGANAISAFNANGFSLGNDAYLNDSGSNIVSWTFRKAPKFFDVVTYTGDGQSSKTISHSLGSAPSMILIKQTNTTRDWVVYHHSLGTTKHLRLNSTSAAGNDNSGEYWGGTTPTSTQFSLGSYFAVNQNGGTYVAYLFAHNDGDGEFGPDGSDIIKCGSVVADGSGNATVDLGFEPQWLMVKNATSSGYDWQIFDTMRGFKASPDNDSPALFANTSGAESGQGDPNITSTGFTWDGGGAAPNNTYIFMAIRRGPLAQPESGTEVFAPIAYTTTDGTWQDRILESNFTTDLSINGYRNITDGGTHTFVDRLRGYANILRSHQTSAESIRTGDYYPWPQTGQSVTSNEWSKYNGGNGLDYYNYQWKRAPGFFDVVAYSGNSTNNRELKHNLNVIPEMVWFKARSDVKNWHVYTAATGNTITGTLNETTLFEDASAGMASSPTASSIFLKNSNENNGTGLTYIAYLFATLAGVSKVGSYTGNGSSQIIDCGFTSSARFILVKRTDSTGDWYLWDTARGVVAGNAPHLSLNTTAAEVTSDDSIDPDNSGFIVNQVGATNINVSSATYIFYAIA